MKKYNILVTGVGAIIGYGIIRNLRKSKYDVKIIGMDIHEDAVGQEWCDIFVQGVYASDKRFICFLNSTIEKYKIDLVIPGIEQDLHRIAIDFEFCTKDRVKYAINDTSLIEILNDKWETHTFFLDAGIDLIPTFKEGIFQDIKNEIGLPMFLKPRKSYASKGIFTIQSEEDFLYWRNKLKGDFLVQKIMGKGDEEYTVSVFGFGDGNYTNLIALKRKLGADGATAKAETVFKKGIAECVDRIVSFSKPIGPTNIQLIRDHNKYYLLEINPRISSSTAIRQYFGINEAEMCIDFYLEGKLPNQRKIRIGKARRYIAEIVSYDCNNF